jgi:cytochrome c oxidase subunit II
MDRPMKFVRRSVATASLMGMLVAPLPALAQAAPPVPSVPTLGAPRPWQMTLQAGYSPVKLAMISLNHLVLVIIGIISAVVAGLLLWVIWRYNAKRNPVPSHTTHHTVLEIAWTVIPILILVIIAIPSFRLVYYEDKTDHPDMTIKVTAHQWYWEYGYPEQKNLDFMSSIVPGDQLKPGQPRLLTANNPLVVPVNKNIRILIASSDVIHSFFIPSLGVQRYAIPGRTIETWMRIDRPGRYYGQCNQICGTNHSRMPIDVVAVTDPQFQAWATQAEKVFSADATPSTSPSTETAAAGGQLVVSATDTQR